jgi:hypothetical protein
MALYVSRPIVDRSLYCTDALEGRCAHCGRTDLPLTDVLCTSELSGAIWHNVYCSVCLVDSVDDGYLIRTVRPICAASPEPSRPVRAEVVGPWLPPSAPSDVGRQHLVSRE